jgi:hypothetical protein
MKKNLLVAFTFIVLSVIGFQAASAQITITLPKFPKIKKDKPAETKTEATTTKSDGNQTENKPVKTESNPAPPSDKCSENGWLTAHIEMIAERQQEVDSFTSDRGWLTSTSTYDHLLNAVSPSAREKWLTGAKALEYKDCPNLVTAFDKLSASAAQKIPLFIPNTRAYAIHNPIEEKLMKSKINNLTDHKIHYIGIKQASWLIDKNSLGIPTSRYKHGMVWARYTPNDHPYCRIYYINIIQDYAGGGTYGASYGYFVRDELAGCPAGK